MCRAWHREAEIREIARSFELSVRKPSNACLASRIPTGSEVTYEKLQRIENAEIVVKTILASGSPRERSLRPCKDEVGRDELHKMFDVTSLLSWTTA